MLRTLFVLTIAAIGLRYSLRGPFYLLLLYLWIAYFRPEYWVWGGLATSLPLSFVAGVLLVVTSVLSSETRLRVTGTTVLLFVLLAQSFASTIASAHFDYAWPYWTDFAKSTLIAWLIVCLVNDSSRFRLTLIVIVASLGFEAAKQGWAELARNPGEKNHNWHPFLGDENGVALGVLMLVPVLSALARTSQVKWERATYAFAIIGMIYRAITTYSRGAFLSGGALLVIHLARSKRRLRTVCAIVILAAIVVPVLPDAYWKRMDTIAFSEDTLNQEDSSSRGRLHFWRVAVAMANANPLLGVGHNAFNPSYDTYDFLDGLYGTDRAVHSAWFGILAELGYVGAALFIVIVAAALASAIRIRRAAARGQLPPELGIYATALESSFVVYLVGATFLSAQYSEMLWHFIGLSGALSMIASTATAAATKALDAPAQTPAPRQVAAAARGVVRAGSQRRVEHRRMPHATTAIRASARPAPMRLVDRGSS